MKKSFFASVICFLYFTSLAMAQFDAALYGLHSIAQSGLYNPAIKSDMRLSVGLGQTGSSAYSTGFSAFEALAEGSDVSENLDNLINQVRSNDIIHLRNDINVLYTAFNLTPNMQLSFGGQINHHAYTQVPVNLLRILRGNNQEDILNKEVNFGGFGFEFAQTFGIHSGLQYQINDQWSVGMRAYFFNGFIHYQMRSSDNNVWAYLGEDEWRLDSDVSIRSSDYINDESLELREELPFLNPGYQFDLGVAYQYNDRLSISASILGLGSMRYSYGLENTISRGTFDYRGIDVTADNFNINSADIIDSLIQSLDFMTNPGEAYSRSRPFTAFLAAHYEWTPRHQFSFINSFNRWGDLQYINSSLRYLYAPWKHLHGMVNINTFNGRLWGVGAGFQARVNGAQFFLLTDFMQPNFNISKVRGLSLNLGLNVILFPKREQPKA